MSAVNEKSCNIGKGWNICFCNWEQNWERHDRPLFQVIVCLTASIGFNSKCFFYLRLIEFHLSHSLFFPLQTYHWERHTLRERSWSHPQPRSWSSYFFPHSKFLSFSFLIWTHFLFIFIFCLIFSSITDYRNFSVLLHWSACCWVVDKDKRKQNKNK